MSLVATDGHRLALVTVDRKGGKPSKEGEESQGDSSEERRCGSSASC